MKQLIRLKSLSLYKCSTTILPDGDKEYTETLIDRYKCIVQELSDNIDASIYGSNINRMLRIASPKDELETYLKSKVNNTSDNISMYKIHYQNNVYKIISVRSKYIDLERE